MTHVVLVLSRPLIWIPHHEMNISVVVHPYLVTTSRIYLLDHILPLDLLLWFHFLNIPPPTYFFLISFSLNARTLFLWLNPCLYSSLSHFEMCRYLKFLSFDLICWKIVIHSLHYEFSGLEGSLTFKLWLIIYLSQCWWVIRSRLNHIWIMDRKNNWGLNSQPVSLSFQTILLCLIIVYHVLACTVHNVKHTILCIQQIQMIDCIKR